MKIGLAYLYEKNFKKDRYMYSNIITLIGA